MSGALWLDLKEPSSLDDNSNEEQCLVFIQFPSSDQFLHLEQNH